MLGIPHVLLICRLLGVVKDFEKLLAGVCIGIGLQGSSSRKILARGDLAHWLLQN